MKICLSGFLATACTALILATGTSAPTIAHADTITYYHNDFLGSPVVATDSAGAVIWRQTYKPYGERMASEEGSFSNKIRYANRHQDDDTGLAYMGARYYDLIVGRFMSMDPVKIAEGNVHSFNRYAYGNNNPHRYVDPDGRDSVVANGRINITPIDRGVPRVNLPNNVGATGVSSSSWSFHEYNVTTSSVLSAGAAGQGLKNNPTPGRDSPASSLGTINDVGSIPSAGDSNLVRSYFIPSPDPSRYTDITVNHTIAGEHGLNEGYVIRYGEIGQDGSVTLRSYGEGNAMRQAPVSRMIWRPMVESMWQQNQQDINNGR